MGNFERFINVLGDTERDFRKDAMTDKVNGLTIDTVMTPDTQKFETGIKKDDVWTIVEVYESEEAAKVGHKTWVKIITETPDIELKECMSPGDWFFG